MHCTGKMLKILLIDDNSGFRDLVKETLLESRLKFTLVEGVDPIDGLKQITKHQFHFDYLFPSKSQSD